MMTAVADYMRTRRSTMSMLLEEPGPNEEQLKDIVSIATRVPDHGKLAPWRLELWPMEMREELNTKLLDFLGDGDDVAKERARTAKILHAPCLVAVISTAAEHPAIPVWEQELSAGAVCMNMLIAANAHGFEAQWLTNWFVYNDEVKPLLGLGADERIAGLMHIGTSNAPKTDRDRPALDDVFSVRQA
ncbi:MAG: nitroreductase [Pseudomonadota bacterium]